MNGMMLDAADRIMQAQQKRITELEEALRPFAYTYTGTVPHLSICPCDRCRARKVLDHE